MAASQPNTQDPVGGVEHLTAQPEQDPRTIERAKQQVRDRIWTLLEREHAAKPPGRVVGKLPNFLGAEGRRRPARGAASVGGGPRGQG